MTHHTAKANLEKGSCWPLEAMKKVLYHPTLLVVTLSNRPTPWTHPTTPPSPDSFLRVIYYKLIYCYSLVGGECILDITHAYTVYQLLFNKVCLISLNC